MAALSNRTAGPSPDAAALHDAALAYLARYAATEAGLRRNIDVGLQYLESWLRGNGCVPIYDLMEDAATAEISRSQLWQWIRHHARTNDGRAITPQMFDEILAEVVARLKLAETTPKDHKFDRAAELFTTMSKGEFEEFLTSVAYRDLT